MHSVYAPDTQLLLCFHTYEYVYKKNYYFTVAVAAAIANERKATHIHQRDNNNNDELTKIQEADGSHFGN